MSDRINAPLFPPLLLVTNPVKSTVMCGAQRNNPFVADLSSHCPGLCEAQVMGMARAAATDETGLPGHIAQMLFVSNAPWGADREGGFVDLAWSTLGFG